MRFGNRENNLEHAIFGLGARVTAAAQPEPLVLKQSLYSTHRLETLYSPPGNPSPREGGREGFYFME